MKTLAKFLGTMALFLLMGGLAQATTINVGYDPGTTWNVYNIADWVSTGSTMDGMQVTATFYDDDSDQYYSETLSWLGGTGVVSSLYDWSVTMSSYTTNTYLITLDWFVSYAGEDALTSLVFDGASADIVFDTQTAAWDDTILPPNPNDTPGSERGRVITANSETSDAVVDAVYSDIVSLRGTTYGDLYSTLTLNIANGVVAEDGTPFAFSFSMDTDNVNVSVPEPATMLLMGLGLSGLLGNAVRRKRLA